MSYLNQLRLTKRRLLPLKYKIKFKKDAFKFLENHREVKEKFIEAFTKICKDPFTKEYDIKKLIGQDELYRLRVGKYRAIYRDWETDRKSVV